MEKLIKFLLGFLLSFSALVTVLVFVFELGVSLASLQNLFYIGLLLFLIYLIWIFKARSRFTLSLGYYLLMITFFLFVMGFTVFAEFIMRLSFVLWLVGVFQALYEYRTLKTTEHHD